MPDQSLPVLQCLVYIGDIEKLFEDGKRSVLLLVPIRLGSDVFNRIYIPCVKVESCVYVYIWMCGDMWMCGCVVICGCVYMCICGCVDVW